MNADTMIYFTIVQLRPGGDDSDLRFIVYSLLPDQVDSD